MSIRKMVCWLHSANAGWSHVKTPKANATQIVAPLNASQPRRNQFKTNQTRGRQRKTGELGTGRLG